MIRKADGRYLYYYSFDRQDVTYEGSEEDGTEDSRRGERVARGMKDRVRAKMEPSSRGMGRDGHPQARPDVQTP